MHKVIPEDNANYFVMNTVLWKKNPNPEVEFFRNSILFNSVCNDAISYLDWNGKHYVEHWVLFTCSEYVDIISKFH